MNATKWKIYGAGLLALALLVAPNATVIFAQNSTNFVGTWQMSMEGRNGRGGGGGRNRGGGEQTLTIAQEGGNYKVTHTTPQGDQTYDATVSGNTISWIEMRQGRDGNTMSIAYKATVDGDTMTGTMGGGQFNRQFTAKRSS